MSKTRLKYDIIAKRAEETESGVNIDLALMRRKTEIQNISNTLSQTIDEVQKMDEIVTSAAEIAISMDERLDEVEEVVSDTSAELLQLEGYVDQIDAELDNKLDKSESANYYPRHENPDGFITADALNGYATESWVNEQGFIKEIPDTFATKTWVQEQHYLTEVPDTYAKTADVNEEFDNTSAWANSKFQIQGDYVTSAGLTAKLAPYAKTADVNLSIERATSGKLDKSSSAEFYPRNENPAGYLTEHQDLSSYATKQYVTEKTSAFITSAALDPYAKTTFVNEELAKKQNISEMSAYATSAWADGRFQPKGDYVETSDLDNYYTKDETSGASEIRDALAEKAPVGDYVTNDELEEILEPYATQEWVGEQNFVDETYLNAALEPYATQEYVDTGLAKKFDSSATSAFAQSAWTEQTYQHKGDYVTSAGFNAAIDNYYKRDETSGAAELEAEFKKYQTSGQYVTSAGLTEVLDDYKTASEVEDALADTSAWAKSVFASAAQLSDYATTQDLQDGLDDKLDKTESAKYYPMTGNPSNFLVQADLAGYATETYVVQETSGKLDKSESANYWPQATANEVIPAGTDASNQLVNELGLAAAIANFGGFKKSTPDASGKPTETVPNTKTIYLTYVSSSTGPDKYNEWIWDSAGNDYERIGDTTLDLTGYATETYVNQNTSGKIDWASSGQFYLASNPDGFIDSTALEPYAQTTYVDAGLNKKFDTSAMSAYAESAWVAANFQSAGQFVTSAGFNEAIAEYYKKNETSGAAELTAEFAKYQLEGDYVTSAGLTEKLNETSAWANDTFQPVGSYATTTDLDNTSAWAEATFASASQLDDYYPVTNPEGYITEADLVQADWEEADATSKSYIQNKPEPLSLQGDSGIRVTETQNALVISVSADFATKSYVDTGLSDKVDKETGKGLSHEDFTSAYKNKIDGIETGANKNVQPDWEEVDTASDSFIQNKPAPISLKGIDGIEITDDNYYIYVGVSADYATNDDLNYVSAHIPSLAGYATEHYVQQQTSGKVDKVAGKDLSTNDFTDALKNKLDGIEDDAQVNVQADWAEVDSTSDAYIQNKPTPLSMAAGEGISIVESNDTITFSVSASYAAASALDYVSAGVDYVSGALNGYATTSDLQTGLADKVDKVTGKGLSTNDYDDAASAKLFGIQAGAEVNVQSDWGQSDNTADDFIKNKPTPISMSAGNGISITEANNTVTFAVTDAIATSAWVASNFASAAQISDMATQTWVGQQGFATNDDVDYVSGGIDYVSAAVNTKVAQVPGKGLSTNDYDNAASAKLFGIEAGAEVNVQSDWNVTNSALDSYIMNKPDILIPLASTSYAAPTNIVVVTAMPPAADIDPTTIYLVKESVVP